MRFFSFVLLVGLLAAAACKPKGKLLLDTPTFDAYQSERTKSLVQNRGKGGGVTFKVLETKPSKMIDYEWFDSNKLVLPAMAYHHGAVVAPLKKMKTQVDWSKYRAETINKKSAALAHVIEQENVALLIYGNPPNELKVITDTWGLVIRDMKTQEVKHTIDFSNYCQAPEFTFRDKDFVWQDLLWAQVEDNILYFSTAHWTYAESTKGKNAYISALDLTTKTLLWRSEPLRCNATNFEIKGNHIFTGYGFTMENAMIYALHKIDGTDAGKIELRPKNSDKKFIEYLIFKDGKLHVHCHDKSYILQVNQ